jgi:hypothetical protein
MKSGLWVVILVVAIFMGFLMGYSLPPMIEVGMIGGGQDEAIGLKTDVDEDMEQYYKQLSQDDE